MYGHRAWYSDRLFEPDPRFPLTAALGRVADPAGVSHPQIDRRLEDPRGTRAVDWLIDGEPPDHPASPVAAVTATTQDPGELNRLDTFIDRLRSASPAPEPLPEFLIYNAEHVASSAVRLSGDRTRYDEVDRLHPDGRT